MSSRSERDEGFPPHAEAVYEEYRRRREQGEDIDLDALCDEHPRLAASLRVLHSLHAARGDGEAGTGGATQEDPAVRGAKDSPEVAGLFGRTATVDGGASGGPAPRDPGRIGPYRILEVLGEGGMGVVYLAEQKEPVRRRVAIKLIKLGMDTREVVARFEAERQALALMSHPAIAKVYDAGSTEDGRPYFVMEYVPGVPIHEYCDRHRLSTRDRLDLFLRVCEGVQHAHQKGVIHRDIKPSNVLIRIQDDRAAVKIIDFGIAKATRAEGTGSTLVTEAGQAVGTLEYMSPEQALGSGRDVDTRADVYSLGVLLYEVLTGALPFDPKELRSAGPDGTQRLIAETPPPKPSTLVSRRSRESRLAAQHRGTEPASLVRELRGDLDWITLRAMEKDRSRRYASVSELAADIRRHLRHEVVLAGPPSFAYAARRFLRRHRTLVGAAGAVIVTLIAVTATSTRFYFVALREERRARAGANQASVAEGLALKNARIARRQGKRAEERLEEILRLSDVKRLAELEARAATLWPCLPGKAEAMRRWLADARELASRLDRHRADAAGIRARLRAGDEAGSPAGPSALPPAGDASRTTLRWQLDTLAELIEDLEAFSGADGTIASVAERLEFAETIRRRSVEEHREAWNRAIRSIADPGECPAYAGLEIRPQVGLVPLGRDPASGLWEFAHLQTGSPPERIDGRLRITEGTGLVFVLLPGGTFRMGAVRPNSEAEAGSPHVDPYAHGDESPVVEVTLSPFFLSKYEMTQGQWSRFTGENPSYHGAEAPLEDAGARLLHPVERVSWTRCHEVLGQLGLVLPTEAQWEYAARGGTTTVWWTGDRRASLEGAANLLDLAAAQADEGTTKTEAWNDGYAGLAPVGRFRANAFGLHDVVGNVWEWCLDLHGPYSAPRRPGTGEKLLENGRGRVQRGGGFQHISILARSANNVWRAEDFFYRSVGVRPARPLAPPPSR